MADKILADPSRRRLFEKDDIFSLIQMPSQVKKNGSSDTTDGSDSEQTNNKISKPKCVKISSKAIKKDKKLQMYIT
jgi:hypothetical protein